MEQVKIWERYKLCAKFVFIIGLMAHAFCYFNVMYSHDSLWVYTDNWTTKIGLGRFAQAIYIPFREVYAAPWLIGILSLFFVSLTVFLIVQLFDVENKYSIAAIAGILTTSYSFTLLNATYIFVADVYMLAVLTYTLAAYLLIKYKHGYLLGSVCVAFALGLYQAYIPVTLLLIMFWVLFCAFKNREFKNYIMLAYKSIGMFVGAYVLYKIGLQIYLNKFDVVLSGEYNGIASVGDYSEYNLFSLIKGTLVYIKNYYFSSSTYNTDLLQGVNVLISIVLIILLVVCLIKCKTNMINKTIIIICLLCMPLAMNSVYVISKGMLHHLMTYSFCFPYVLLLLLLDYIEKNKYIEKDKVKKIIFNGSFILIGVIVFRSVIYSNDVYLKKQLEYDNTLMVFNRIIDEIEELDNYEVSEDTEVVFLGNMSQSELFRMRKGFEKFSDATGLGPSLSVTSYPKYKLYFDNILNYPINVVDQEIVNQYLKMDEVKEMPAFPYEGSVRMIDGRVVVKIADE